MPSGVYLDTNVYLNWAMGRKLSVLRHLRRSNAAIFLAPSVVIEAIEDYWFAPTTALSIYRRALKLIVQCGAQRVLQPTETFTLNLLGIPRRQRYSVNVSPGQLRRWLRFAIGLPRIRHAAARSATDGFNKAAFKRLLDAYRDSHIRMLEEVKDKVFTAAGVPPGGRSVDAKTRTALRAYLASSNWAEIYYRFQVQHLRPEAQVVASRSLSKLNSAAFEFDTAIVDLLLAGGGYSPASHRGDVFDRNLLTYLADPDLSFITADAKMKGKITKAPQRHRIIVV